MFMGMENETAKTITATVIASLFIGHVVGLAASVCIVDNDQALFVMLAVLIVVIILFYFAITFFSISLENAQVNSEFFMLSLFFGCIDGLAIHYIYWKNRDYSRNWNHIV